MFRDSLFAGCSDFSSQNKRQKLFYNINSLTYKLHFQLQDQNEEMTTTKHVHGISFF